MRSISQRLLLLIKNIAWDAVAVFLLSLVFFAGTSYYNYHQLKVEGSLKWTSPDESANYYFTNKFASDKQLAVFEKINLVSSDLVHPRSFRSDVGWLKPVSFLGIIIIFGYIGSLIGIAFIPFLTPAFAALGIIFFYALIKKLFDRRTALLSAFILASFPVYIYYTVRSMFHNVLFIVFVIISLYFLLRLLDKKYLGTSRRFFQWRSGWSPLFGYLFIFLSGLFLGLAVMTRASELIWLAPLFFIIWLFNIKRAGWLRPLIFVAAFLLAILPSLYYNQVLYDSPWRGGYNQMNSSLVDISQAGKELASPQKVFSVSTYSSFISSLSKNVFYFGFNPRLSFKAFYYYCLQMFPWLFLLGIMGLAFFIADNLQPFRRRFLVYILGLLVTSVILVFYYGSWQFNDNPDPNSFTIGNSYTRYWLPIYLFFIPLVALFIVRLSRAVLDPPDENGRHRHLLPVFLANALQMVAVFAIMFWSINFVMFGSEEGLAYLSANNYAAKKNGSLVVSLTESNSVVITQYFDKYVFPERKVVVGLLNDDNMNYYYARLAEQAPLYYYNFTFPAKDLAYLNNSKLAVVGLKIIPIKKIDRDFSLYLLEKIK